MSDAEWQQKGLDLHYRLLQGDPTAQSDLFETFFLNLVADLKKKYPNVDTDLISDAAYQASANYVDNPQLFDPTRKTLFGYLKMSAEGDLRNALRSQKRYYSKIRPLDDVALSTLAGNINIERDFIIKQELLEKLHTQKQLNQQIADTNSLDQQLLTLLQQKERRTSEFARVLGIENLPVEEQRAIVKNHKDRLKLRLKRSKAKE